MESITFLHILVFLMTAAFTADVVVRGKEVRELQKETKGERLYFENDCIFTGSGELVLDLTEPDWFGFPEYDDSEEESFEDFLKEVLSELKEVKIAIEKAEDDS